MMQFIKRIFSSQKSGFTSSNDTSYNDRNYHYPIGALPVIEQPVQQFTQRTAKEYVNHTSHPIEHFGMSPSEREMYSESTYTTNRIRNAMINSNMARDIYNHPSIIQPTSYAAIVNIDRFGGDKFTGSVIKDTSLFNPDNVSNMVGYHASSRFHINQAADIRDRRLKERFANECLFK